MKMVGLQSQIAELSNVGRKILLSHLRELKRIEGSDLSPEDKEKARERAWNEAYARVGVTTD